MTAAIEKFAEEYGLPGHAARRLVRFANRAARENERACNGDPHPDNPNPADKNENARLWEADLNATTDAIKEIVVPAGLTVEYTGLRPCLRKDGRYVEIPY